MNQYIKELSRIITRCFKNDGKLLIAGNGGSACEASHFAGELVGKFKLTRKGLPAISLNDPGIITAVGNDLGFEHVFSRQVEAYGQVGDVLICLTTSDSNDTHSINLESAICMGNRKGLTTAVIGSNKTRILAKLAYKTFKIEGKDTSEIQENQLKFIHQVCELVESKFI